MSENSDEPTETPDDLRAHPEDRYDGHAEGRPGSHKSGRKSRASRAPKKKRSARWPKVLSFFVGLFMVACTVGAIAVWLVYEHFSEGLPDYYQLASYDPPVVTRVYAGDGRLLAEYAIENRVFVPIKAIPKRVINAFLSAEDKTFYSHPGIDIPSVIKAAWTNAANHFLHGDDRRPIGASTITQQVTKNFLLSNELSYGRKVKEAILALRIEKAFSKDRILELYLNQIYLGSGNYGVAAASINYFNKSLDELTIAEAAYLGALPKAPNNYNMKRNPAAAKERRDWVIDRMAEDGHITPAEAEAAKAEPLEQRARGQTERVTADYFAEEVRRELIQRFGEDGLYKKGLTVRATVDPKLQEIADRVLRKGLVSFDRTQGYRGPLKHLEPNGDWKAQLAGIEAMPWLYDWSEAMVISADKTEAKIGLKDGSEASIPLAELTWARLRSPEGRLGPQVKAASDVLRPGDVVAVEPVKLDKDGKDYPPNSYGLRQVPEISGAIVSLDPHTGRVLALTGGWSYEQSEFNRATQANRQPGSAFKLDHHSRRADRDRSGAGPATVEAGEFRAGVPRARHHARGPGAFAQSDDHPHGADHRHGEGGGDGRASRRHRQSAADPGDVDRRRRDHLAAACHRLRHDRQRRQEDHADLRRPGTGRPGLDGLSA
jgi:penicillin-binding protein 1A